MRNEQTSLQRVHIPNNFEAARVVRYEAQEENVRRRTTVR